MEYDEYYEQHICGGIVKTQLRSEHKNLDSHWEDVRSASDSEDEGTDVCPDCAGSIKMRKQWRRVEYKNDSWQPVHPIEEDWKWGTYQYSFDELLERDANENTKPI